MAKYKYKDSSDEDSDEYKKGGTKIHKDNRKDFEGENNHKVINDFYII